MIPWTQLAVAGRRAGPRPLGGLSALEWRYCREALWHTYSAAARALQADDWDDEIRALSSVLRNLTAEARRDLPQEASPRFEGLVHDLAAAFLALNPARESGPILARAFIDAVDWSYPSRYAAVRAFQKASADGTGPSLSQSSLSKIAKGRGIGLSLLSRATELLDLRLDTAAYSDPPVLVGCDPWSLPEPEQPRSCPPVVECPVDLIRVWLSASSPQAFVDKISHQVAPTDPSRPEVRLQWDREPLLLFVPGPLDSIQTLLPIRPWGGGVEEGDEIARYVQRARDWLGEQCGITALEQASLEGRHVLSWDSANVPPDTAVLVSAFDACSPLVRGLQPRCWISPMGASLDIAEALHRSLRNLSRLQRGERDHFRFMDSIAALPVVARTLAANSYIPMGSSCGLLSQPIVETLLLEHCASAIGERERRRAYAQRRQELRRISLEASAIPTYERAIREEGGQYFVELAGARRLFVPPELHGERSAFVRERPNPGLRSTSMRYLLYPSSDVHAYIAGERIRDPLVFVFDEASGAEELDERRGGEWRRQRITAEEIRRVAEGVRAIVRQGSPSL